MPYSDSKYVLPQTLGILRLVAKTAMATVYTYTHTHTHTTTHTTHTHTTHKQTHTHYTHPDTHYAHTHTHTLHTHTHTHTHTSSVLSLLLGWFLRSSRISRDSVGDCSAPVTDPPSSRFLSLYFSQNGTYYFCVALYSYNSVCSIIPKMQIILSCILFQMRLQQLPLQTIICQIHQQISWAVS